MANLNQEAMWLRGGWSECMGWRKKVAGCQVQSYKQLVLGGGAGGRGRSAARRPAGLEKAEIRLQTPWG